MKNDVYYLIKKGKFQLSRNDLDVLKPNYVRVQFLYCGICGGDYSCFLGRRTSYPYSLGHEFVAKVIDIGKEVDTFSVNDFVISDFNYRCGKCLYCLKGKDHLCIQNNVGYFTNRAFAEYADIHKNYLYNVKILKNITNATLVEPLSCVIHAYEEILSICKPQCILIVGLGNIGMLFAFYLKLVVKMEKVFVHDSITEKKRRIIKLFKCTEMNMDNSQKYDFIIDATNSITGANFCLAISRFSQKYCMMSHLYGLDTSFIYEMMCQKEIKPIFPLRNGNRNNIHLATQIIHKYWHPNFDEVMEIFPISQIQQVFDKKCSLKSNKQIISMNHADEKI